MTDWWIDHGDVRIAHGDAVEVLRTMDEESVQCIVTSPPFWALRDYGTRTWVGGDEGCDHLVVNATRTAWANSVPGPAAATGKNAKFRNETKETGGHCGKCGARRVDQQIGLEDTPEGWVDALVAVFRECRRVLRPDGVMWVEVGDTYNAFNGNRGPSQGLSHRSDPARNHHTTGLSAPGLKQKDLVGAPWLLAFALRADGWYLRSEVIWNKLNPMPESVSDRPTTAHSRVFLLTRRDRYFFDADAIREEYKMDGRKVTTVVGTDASAQHRNGERWPNPAGANARSVWSIPTEPTPFAHFATFPQALVEKCLKAGTSEHGACPECSAPWRRLLAVSAPGKSWTDHRSLVKRAARNGRTMPPPPATVGWAPTCDHYDHLYDLLPRPSRRRKAEQRDRWPGRWERVRRRPGSESWRVVPCVCLDPFMGSGTTALVARRLGRHAVGIDLSLDYLSICADRLKQLSLFA